MSANDSVDLKRERMRNRDRRKERKSTVYDYKWGIIMWMTLVVDWGHVMYEIPLPLSAIIDIHQ